MEVGSILIIHPTRKRPSEGIATLHRTVNNMTSKVRVKYVLSFDIDDDSINTYRQLFKSVPENVTVKFVQNFNRGAVDATNRAGESYVDEDVLLTIADDIILSAGWDSKLFAFINMLQKDEYFIHIQDGIPNSATNAIIQCLSGAYYKRLGYIVHPDYISLFADTDALNQARVLGVLYEYSGQPLGIIHDHPSFKGSAWDETYVRTNRREAFDSGHAVYCRRQQEGFPI